MKQSIIVAVVLSSLVTAIPSAFAGSSFQLPSKKIHCQAAGDRPIMRCDVFENNAKLPPRPKSCEFDWGTAFSLQSTGRPQRLCVSDTVATLAAPILRYGRTWKYEGLTCISRVSGLTCTNLKKHGFFLSRQRQRLF